MHAPPFVEDQVMRDRLKETCEREFECGVERMVKRVFEARRGLPDELYEIPWIGSTYRPRAPRTSHADLMRNVCRALCAQKWFEHTAPSQAPATVYALALRSTSWDRTTHPPFDEFLAHELRRQPQLTVVP